MATALEEGWGDELTRLQQHIATALKRHEKTLRVLLFDDMFTMRKVRGGTRLACTWTARD